MKIALVTNCFLPQVGGVEFVVHHLANQWAGQGHEVCVFNSLADKAVHPEALYKVKRYAILRGATRFGYHSFPWLNISVRSLSKLINDYNPDFISGHVTVPVAFYLANLKPMREWIITGHNSGLTRYKFDLELARALNAARSVVAISKKQKDNLLAIGVAASKIVIIQNGADLERLQSPVSVDIRKLFGIRSDKKLVLTVGSNKPQKNFQLGLQVFAEIVKINRDAHYLIVGKGTSALRESIRRFGISDNVTVCEGLAGDCLVGAYQQSCVFLSTSFWESCPLVILESMASGLPQIATDVQGNRDLIDDGVTGLLIELNNPQAMARAAVSLLDNAELRMRMGENNLQKAKEFSWQKVSRRYLELS